PRRLENARRRRADRSGRRRLGRELRALEDRAFRRLGAISRRPRCDCGGDRAHGAWVGCRDGLEARLPHRRRPLARLRARALGKAGEARHPGVGGQTPAPGLASFLALASLGGADPLSPTIPNMLAVAHPLQVAAVGFLAALAAMLAGFAVLLGWEVAPPPAGGRLSL